MIDTKKHHGPCFMKLFSRFLAVATVPHGGGIDNVIRFFGDSAHRKSLLDDAMKQTEGAIELIRSAPDNTLGTDEETIACFIMQKVYEREKA